MDTAFVLLIGVMLLCRAGLKRDVPMAAFYLACTGWALELFWAPVSGLLDWMLSAFGLVERYDAPPSALKLLSLVVSTLSGLALIIAVLIAARKSPVEGSGAGKG
ncbi:MAG: hypothetical protein V4850_24620 [Myxococcota bacterium]